MNQENLQGSGFMFLGNKRRKDGICDVIRATAQRWLATQGFVYLFYVERINRR